MKLIVMMSVLVCVQVVHSSENVSTLHDQLYHGVSAAFGKELKKQQEVLGRLTKIIDLYNQGEMCKAEGEANQLLLYVGAGAEASFKQQIRKLVKALREKCKEEIDQED